MFLRTSSYKAIWGCLFCFISSLRYKVKIMNITLSCAIWKIITTLTDLISFCVATDSIWEHTKKEKLKLVHWFWKWPVFTHISSVIRRKSESQNGCLRKETGPNFQKNQHFYILIRTRRCAYLGVWSVRFSKNLIWYLHICTYLLVRLGWCMQLPIWSLWQTQQKQEQRLILLTR